uniref:Zinc metalloproteinase n=1 Tax=Strongyloides venezuelensis TaxID=75913 RepID=A0A0K0EVV2_STRVS
MNFFVKLFLFSQCILETISKNESSIIVDGDSESSETRVKKSILRDRKFKWSLPIHYHISFGVNRELIKSALAILERETCIRFRESNDFRNGGINYVQKGADCYSHIGKISRGWAQEIVLGSQCHKVPIVLHETMHALGMIHEMSRHDRNSYIKLNYQNIDYDVIYNSQPYHLSKATPYGLKYDYGSLMHYDRFAGSINGRLAMEPKYWSYLKTMGQGIRLGFNDAKQLNIHYCSDKCRDSKLNCKMNGYPDPNKKCTVCKCPPFYTGTRCTELFPSQRQCGATRLNAKNTDQPLIVNGIKTCYIQITAPLGRKVRLHIGELSFRDSFTCQPNKGLEVKFLADKSVSGALFCGRVVGGFITSENNVVVMKYVGLTRFSSIRIRYRYV